MKKPLIAVIDYGMGNLRSVSKALEKAGGRIQVTDSPSVILSAQGVVLPGVGAFGDASKRLAQTGLGSAALRVIGQDKPFLGICLGLQLLFERSEESRGQQGLGIWKGVVRRFPKNLKLKVPHMGWNTLASPHPNPLPKGRGSKAENLTSPVRERSTVRSGEAKHALLSGIKPSDYFYFVHSYYPVPEDLAVIATTTTYGNAFCSAAAQENVFATQFHPEKSAVQGQTLLRNFVKQVTACS